MKVILSGGGTGGHIFPAIAIADKIKSLVPTADIRFVGAQGRMEMERVPQAGYPIEGLWISGIQRKLTFQNVLFPLKLISSLWKAEQILRREKPQVVVGTGGYASGPLLKRAAALDIPTLIQEQNAYAGLTNKWLAGSVDRICVAYPEMERYFPAEKLILAGNPVREKLLAEQDSPEKAKEALGFNPHRPLLMVMGGSLGARTLNRAVAAAEPLIQEHGLQLLWQCGKLYEEEYRSKRVAKLAGVKMTAFVDRMETAYAAAEVVVARAGALTIAELCLLGKAAVLVPSPNVAEDHQTTNALALVERNAALLVKDEDAENTMIATAIELLNNSHQRAQLEINAQQLGFPDATARIAEAVLELASP